MSAPFFIVGSGRSGSTLLRVILCAHSRITIPPETYFIMPLLERLPSTAPLDGAQVSEALEIITGHYRWPDMSLSKEEFSEAVVRLDRPRLRDVLNVIYNFHLEKDGKTIWGDKTPPYVSIIPGLVSLYPDARIVHLLRDGRDVAKSFQRTGWYGPWLHDNTREWRTAIRHIHDCRRNHPEIGIYEIRYEDLVLNMEATVHALCRHLGIDFEPGMLNWTQSLDGRIPEREAHIHRKLQRKPQRSDIDRWKTEMTRRELLVAEAFLIPELVTAGYVPYYCSPIWKPLLLICRVYCSTVLPLYSLFARAYSYLYRRIFRKSQ